MLKIKGNIFTDIKAAADAFLKIRRKRCGGNEVDAGRTKEVPYMVSGGFYNTVEGCTLSWCEKDIRNKAEEAFDRLPGEVKHQLQWSPKEGEFIERANLWRSILKPAMPPQQYRIAMGRIIHQYVHIKQMRKEKVTFERTNQN